jgi:hypothetical protein
VRLQQIGLQEREPGFFVILPVVVRDTLAESLARDFCLAIGLRTAGARCGNEGQAGAQAQRARDAGWDETGCDAL